MNAEKLQAMLQGRTLERPLPIGYNKVVITNLKVVEETTNISKDLESYTVPEHIVITLESSTVKGAVDEMKLKPSEFNTPADKLVKVASSIAEQIDANTNEVIALLTNLIESKRPIEVIKTAEQGTDATNKTYNYFKYNFDKTAIAVIKNALA